MFQIVRAALDAEAHHVLRLRRLGSGINLNEYPPAVAYLFGKQIYDESTQEMQLCDEMLRRRWARTQKQLFAHPYAQFGHRDARGRLYFLPPRPRQLSAERTHRALNLGPKVIELAWTESLPNFSPTKPCMRFFKASYAETRSHVLMGKFHVERFIQKHIDAEFANGCAPKTRRDYLFFIEETRASRLAWSRKEPAQSPYPAISTEFEPLEPCERLLYARLENRARQMHRMPHVLRRPVAKSTSMRWLSRRRRSICWKLTIAVLTRNVRVFNVTVRPKDRLSKPTRPVAGSAAAGGLDRSAKMAAMTVPRFEDFLVISTEARNLSTIGTT
jgi:hypothetical protein